MITPIVQKVWDSAPIKAFITSPVNAVPEEKRSSVETTIYLLMDSMWVEKLDPKHASKTMAPSFNIYTDSGGITMEDVWVLLWNHLAEQAYTSNMQGRGRIKVAPFHCGVCHSVNHPRGLCPFPDTPGWNGPTKRCPATDGANQRGYKNSILGSCFRTNSFV